MESTQPHNLFVPRVLDKLPDWGPVGYITYKRTYARQLNDKTTETEEWSDTLTRIVRSCQTQLNCDFTTDEQDEIYDMLYNLKFSVAGRFLWQLGTKTVDTLGLASLQNCAFVCVDSPIKPFTWAFDLLMLGSGVGVNLQHKYVCKIPPVKSADIVRLDTKDADYIVSDTRAGWVKLLGKTLKSHFYTGKGFTYSTVCLRSKGAPIKSFGGVASGPETLCYGMSLISDLLNKRANQTENHLRPIDALDIINIIGMIVVSGNIRRSAIIAKGDPFDIEFLQAKRWDLGNIPNYRCFSNNSVVCNDTTKLPPQFWEGYKGNGEPYGLINIDLIRSCGRLGETQYPDPDVKGTNPCSEQCLANYETCCLSDIFLPNINTEDMLWKCVKYSYIINKRCLMLKCHQLETEKIVHKNMRMGVGITGYLQATESQKQWLPACYKKLRQFDVDYSKKHGLPISIKLTTCKPSGTLSLLPGITPGIHPGYSQYFIRRIRFSANSPLVKLCKDSHYHTEFQKKFDNSLDYSTVVISFPCQYPKGTVLAKNCSAIQQLEYVRRMQTDWSDNCVSCTVYYKKEELPDILQWLKEHFTNEVKCVSFLLHSEHGFKQAPYEEITEDEYNELVKDVIPISDSSNIKLDVEEDKYLADSECAGGGCPLR
jgi:ribonucleoside-triphosphate reductase